MTQTPAPNRAPSVTPRNPPRADLERADEVWFAPGGRSPAAPEALEALRAVVERLEREAALARTEIEQANRTKAEFLATISHELRTPLTSIRGFTELLLEDIAGPLTHAQRDQLTRIDAASEHLLGIVEDLLRYSRLTAGAEDVHVEPATLGDVCRSVLDLARPLAHKKGLQLDATLVDSSAILLTDGVKVQQILINLLANAVKFTDRGSVSLGAAIEGDMVLVHVTDTGAGIPAEFFERIFEPFRQIDQSLTRRSGGSGLGLSIARTLARLLGGDLTVASRVGEGSCFSLKIPVGWRRTPVTIGATS